LAVNIATVYRDDIDQWNEEWKVSSIISNKGRTQVEHWYTNCKGYSLGDHTAQNMNSNTPDD
jgi:hypothetical protein